MENGLTSQALAVICNKLGPSSVLWSLACTSKALRRELMRHVEDYLAKHHAGNRLYACLDRGREEVGEDYDKIVKREFKGVELAGWCFNIARRVITLFGVCDGDLAEWGEEFGNRFHLLSLIATTTGRHDHLPRLQHPDRLAFRILVYSGTPAAIDRFVAEAKANAATATAPLP